jgi:hypothetical protein
MKQSTRLWLMFAALSFMAFAAAIAWTVFLAPKRFDYQTLMTYAYDQHPMLVRGIAIDELERRLEEGEINASQMLLFAVKSHADASRELSAIELRGLCELNQLILDLTLKYGADPLTRDGPGGDTALHIAVKSYDACSVRWLVGNGGHSTLRSTPANLAEGLTALESLEAYRDIVKPSESRYQSTKEALAASNAEATALPRIPGSD